MSNMYMRTIKDLQNYCLTFEWIGKIDLNKMPTLDMLIIVIE